MPATVLLTAIKNRVPVSQPEVDGEQPTPPIASSSGTDIVHRLAELEP